MTRPLRHGFTTRFIRGCRHLLTLMPQATVPWLGRLFGWTLSYLAWPMNRTLRHRLSCLVDPPSIPSIWADLGVRLFEFMDAHRQVRKVIIPPETHQVFEDARRKRSGVLVATLHLGHWELMAARIRQLGHPVYAVAAHRKRGPLYTLLNAHRQALGIHTLTPGSGARDAVKHLKSDKIVSMFVDQNTGERGRNIPFLGRLAPTPNTFERLAKLTQATPILVWNVRSERGEYIVRAEPLKQPVDMNRLTARCSEIVAAHPTQWVWMHDRWSPKMKIRDGEPSHSTLDVHVGPS